MPRLIASLLCHGSAPRRRARRRPRRRSGRPPARRSSRARSPGVQRILYEFGPVRITPGQNTIEFEGNELKPDVPGHIVRFKPDLTYADGTVPRVDVIHLHHAVWLSNFRPLFAAGEEKTIFNAPDGYGWVYKPQDSWIMNHMIHNLTPSPTRRLHHLRGRLHPGRDAGRRGRPRPAHGVERRRGRQDLSRLRRPQGRGRPRPALHLPAGVGAGDALAPRPGADRRGRRARRHRGPPAPGRALDRPAGSRATAGRCGCSARRRSTSSRRAPSRGTWR